MAKVSNDPMIYFAVYMEVTIKGIRPFVVVLDEDDDPDSFPKLLEDILQIPVKVEVIPRYYKVVSQSRTHRVQA